MWQDKISIVTEDELKGMVKAVSPDKETYFGKKFLFSMIDERGLRATLDFIKNAKKAIEDYGGLDLNYAFDVDDRLIFKKTHLRWGFVEVCERWGWMVPGAFFAILGALQGYLAITTPVDIPGNANTAQVIYHILTEYINSPAEIMIGIALFREGISNGTKIRLEQLKDTINELGKEIPKLIEEKERLQTQNP